MKKWLFALYPPPGSNDTKRSFKTAFLLGLFISLFLFIFRPFNTGFQISISSIFELIAYGLITSFVTILFLVFIPKLFPTIFQDNNWTFLKEVLYVLLLILSISIFNFFFVVIVHRNFIMSWESLWNIISVTGLIAIIPTVFVITIDMVKNQNKFISESESFKSHVKQKPENITPENNTSIKELEISKDNNQLKFVFESDYDEPYIEMNENEFLFAESEGNYVTFHFIENELYKKLMIRSSLQKTEKIVANSKIIKKTHRSYLVNLDQVSSFDGNAQGYILGFEKCQETAKTSRAFTSMVKDFFKA